MPKHHHHHHHHYHGDDRHRHDAYYKAAGAFDPDAPSPNPHRLHRSEDGVFLGVCGGVAEYFGWKPWHVRIGVLIAFFFGLAGPVLIAYVVMAFVMKRPSAQERRTYDTPEDERFWRDVSTRPKATFSQLRHKFRALDGRLAEMERAVTSEEYKLKQAFQEIE